MKSDTLAQVLNLNAVVQDKREQQYTMRIEALPCSQDTSSCCGGYCGSLLWKKAFSSAEHSDTITIESAQNFAIGSHVTLSLSQKNVLYLQSFLWLFPSLILLLLLFLLPSQWWSLPISVVITASLWLITNTLLKKYQFGLTVKPL